MLEGVVEFQSASFQFRKDRKLWEALAANIWGSSCTQQLLPTSFQLSNWEHGREKIYEAGEQAHRVLLRLLLPLRAWEAEMRGEEAHPFQKRETG